MTAAPTDAPILILKTGDKPPGVDTGAGDFEDWIHLGLSLAGARTLVLDARQDPVWPDLSSLAGIVVTGSPAMVTDHAPWSERTAAWLRQVADTAVPVLGICFGHQLLAHALGGTVGSQPGGPEVGTVSIELALAAETDGLFVGMPWRFDAQVSHRQTVSRLPEGAVTLASSNAEPHQAVRFRPRVWGMQFHPEFSPAATRAFVELQTPWLREHGKNPEAISAAVTETPVAARLLPRFAAMALAARRDSVAQGSLVA